MGFHICEYCQKETSSGDVTLSFANGNTYVMPDMIVHYVGEHTYQPPQHFIDDVMGSYLLGAGSVRWQTKAMPEPVGYLSGAYMRGDVPPLFVYVLAGMMAIITKQGQRMQTRGID